MDDIIEGEPNFRIDERNVDGYNHAIGPCRFFLRLLGSWPDPYIQNTWVSSLRFMIITSTVFLFSTVSQTIKMLLSIRDLNTVIEILANCNIPNSIAIVKLSSIWYHKYALQDLVRQILHDWEITRTDQELAIMWRNAQISRRLSIGCFFITQGTLIAQCVVGFSKPLSNILKRHINDTKEWPLYMLGSFPYDVQVSPNYELSMLGQLICNIFASTSYMSADSFFLVLMFHLIGQLSILKLMIFQLPKFKYAGDSRDFMEAFAMFHTKHNQLCRFSTTIEDCFNMMFLIQITPCILALCMQGYQLIMIVGADDVSVLELIFMIYFLVLFLLTIFSYCYIAELLRQKSAEISYAVYDCDWTALTPKETKLLINIIMRAQNPFEITAGKFATFSLQLYCRILKTSAGYLSMLLAVKD